jgi:PAS domain S-box-containing protein
MPLSLSPKRFQYFPHLGDEDYSAMVLIMESPFGKDDLMAMLDSVEDAVVKLDGSAKYVAMNKAAADIFRRLGQDPEAMIGKSVWELFPDVKGTIVERELHKALEDHTSIKFEFLYPGDQHWYDIQGYPSHPGVILVFRDITGRKNASRS